MALGEAIRREWIYIAAVARTLMLTRGVASRGAAHRRNWLERFARGQPERPAVLYGDRVVTLARARRGRQPLCALGAGAGPEEGRRGRAPDGEPARISDGVARPGEGRRGRRAHQHASRRRAAHPFDRHLRRQAPDPRRRTRRRAMRAPPPRLETQAVVWATGGTVAGAQDLDAALAAQSGAAPEPRAEMLLQGQGALHLHLGHHRHCPRPPTSATCACCTCCRRSRAR